MVWFEEDEEEAYILPGILTGLTRPGTFTTGLFQVYSIRNQFKCWKNGKQTFYIEM